MSVFRLAFDPRYGHEAWVMTKSVLSQGFFLLRHFSHLSHHLNSIH